ncbi:MAG: aspartate-semialdehyde dehydrogenase [Roseburia sp.]|nr:aspartate-semialdehyde dehydrogenase [Anaeroplasma bactoclasticum]MCM1196891.1 aspartate-semialdehyde dehydrogenase [Roseburia sp.]MCM1557607.1 aspartate-semialdehyde dehydrogenase [Anaeroplasma bactoclasticum]
MKKYRVGILGATGAVGREMLKILEEYDFPIAELRLLASKRSVGKEIEFKGNKYIIEEATKNSFQGLDFVLGAASNTVAKAFARDIVASGAVFIDNSSAFRMNDSVPLVVPEINGEDVFLNQGIIANPNCSTIIALMAVKAIHKLSPIESMVASTYQATSGAGAEGPIELKKQMEALCKHAPIVSNVFQHQIVENVIPHIGSFLENGYTTEEMKMQNEGRKILHHPNLKVSCTCVRVPVVRSHSISIDLITKDKLDIELVKNAISKEKGCKLYDSPNENIYPMPIVTSNQDLVYVGRVRKCLIHENGISLWCSGDQIRKGAATNAVQIMMKLIGLLN